MSNQDEIELICAANAECDRLQAKIMKLEKENERLRARLDNYKNQSYRIANQRRELEKLNQEKELFIQQLRIANGALGQYANQDAWVDGIDDTSEGMFEFPNSLYAEDGYTTAQDAIKEIKELASQTIMSKPRICERHGENRCKLED